MPSLTSLPLSTARRQELKSLPSWNLVSLLTIHSVRSSKWSDMAFQAGQRRMQFVR